MSLRTVYHLNLDSETVEGAAIALLPGDPGRVEALARTAPFARCRELANKREYRTWIAYLGATPVLVTSTGIGGPSASIAIDELAQPAVMWLLALLLGVTGLHRREMILLGALPTASMTAMPESRSQLI